MAPGTSFDCSVPLSPEALEICRDRLTNGVLAEDGGCLVDSHHHVG